MIPKYKSLSKGQRRDFEFYKIYAEKDSCHPLPMQDADEHVSKTLEEWYFLWDTHGIITRYSDMSFCSKIIQAKAQLNLTIKMWTEDVGNELIYQWEVFDWCLEMPSWVWTAFVNQVNRESHWQRFKRVIVFKGSYWLPWMDSFDPSI